MNTSCLLGISRADFRLKNLISIRADGSLKAAHGPYNIAKSVADAMEAKLTGLCRFQATNEAWKAFMIDDPKEGLIGTDVLLIKMDIPDGTMITACANYEYLGIEDTELLATCIIGHTDKYLLDTYKPLLEQMECKLISTVNDWMVIMTAVLKECFIETLN